MNKGQFKCGELHPRWIGGRFLTSDGYFAVHSKCHPRSCKEGYIKEHILIAEKVIGMPLPNGVVIHHYGEKTDNAKIVICQDQAYHVLIHARMTAMMASGNPNYRKCVFCKQYDTPANMKHGQNRAHYHSKCRSEYRKKHGH